VLVDFNENTVDLWDVTAAPALLSSTTYPNATYTHSGWPSADQRYVFVHDELEEIQRSLTTQIYTMDIGDLRAPSIGVSYQGPTTTTDHNGYTKGDLYYVSHYRRGVVVFDVSTPNQMREVGHFDTFLAPAGNTAGTDGAWGVYPFLPSGTLVVSDITNGLFVLADDTTALSQSAGRLGFPGYHIASALEGTGSLTVRLQRAGGSAGTVTLQYATSNGTATAGSDYTAASGTLTWPAGDVADKTFTIAIANDTQAESDETIRVTLSNPTGGATIEGATSLDFTITNDDTAPAADSGGGGGGAIDFGWLLLLALLARRRLRVIASR
jgi:hypothetical protein